MRRLFQFVGLVVLASCSKYNSKSMLAFTDKIVLKEARTPLEIAIEKSDLDKAIDRINLLYTSTIDEFKNAILGSRVICENNLSLPNDILRIILSYGQETILSQSLIHLRDIDNNTLLLYAIVKEYKRVVRILIEQGLKICGVNKIKAFQLHWIVKNFESSFLKTSKILKDPSLDIELKNTKGETVLHWAAEHDNIKKTKLLVINYLHSTAVKNKRGLTPLKIAKEKTAVYEFLEQRNESRFRSFFTGSSYSRYDNISCECGTYVMNKYLSDSGFSKRDFGFNKCHICGAFL